VIRLRDGEQVVDVEPVAEAEDDEGEEPPEKTPSEPGNV